MNAIAPTRDAVPTACEQFAAIDGVSSRGLSRLMALNAMKGVPTNPLAGWTTRLWQVGNARVDYDAATDRLRVFSDDQITLYEWSEAVNPTDDTHQSLRLMRLYWNDEVWRQLA